MDQTLGLILSTIKLKKLKRKSPLSWWVAFYIFPLHLLSFVSEPQYPSPFLLLYYQIQLLQQYLYLCPGRMKKYFDL
jgi:hypothetical protein